MATRAKGNCMKLHYIDLFLVRPDFSSSFYGWCCTLVLGWQTWQSEYIKKENVCLAGSRNRSREFDVAAPRFPFAIVPPGFLLETCFRECSRVVNGEAKNSACCSMASIDRYVYDHAVLVSVVCPPAIQLRTPKTVIARPTINRCRNRQRLSYLFHCQIPYP